MSEIRARLERSAHADIASRAALGAETRDEFRAHAADFLRDLAELQRSPLRRAALGDVAAYLESITETDPTPRF